MNLGPFISLIPLHGWIALLLSAYILLICGTAIFRSYTGRIKYSFPFLRLFLIAMFLLIGLTELTYTLANLLWYFGEGSLLLVFVDSRVSGTPVGRLPGLSEVYHTVAGFIRPITNAILVTTVYKVLLKDTRVWT